MLTARSRRPFGRKQLALAAQCGSWKKPVSAGSQAGGVVQDQLRQVPKLSGGFVTEPGKAGLR